MVLVAFNLFGEFGGGHMLTLGVNFRVRRFAAGGALSFTSAESKLEEGITVKVLSLEPTASIEYPINFSAKPPNLFVAPGLRVGVGYVNAVWKETNKSYSGAFLRVSPYVKAGMRFRSNRIKPYAIVVLPIVYGGHSVGVAAQIGFGLEYLFK